MFDRLQKITLALKYNDEFYTGMFIGYKLALRDSMDAIDDCELKDTYKKIDKDMETVLRKVLGDEIVEQAEELERINMGWKDE